MSETSIEDETPAGVDIAFTGAAGNHVAATRFGESGARSVVLVHGGGQTRHAWGATAGQLASAGWQAIAYDQRGHGQSDWLQDGDYSYTAYRDDLAAVARSLGQETGVAPVVIGASLGGVSAMLAEGELGNVLSALVLVDITARPAQAGVQRVLDFMSEHAETGFASLEDAADVIAGYMPQRKRRTRLEGLSKNLRLEDDGRYRWHWDPRFLDCREMEGNARDAFDRRMEAAAAAIRCPVLLVRGRLSDLVSEEVAREFLDLVPHADYADVSAAGHMVAGDSNDVFTDAVTGFLRDLNKPA